MGFPFQEYRKRFLKQLTPKEKLTQNWILFFASSLLKKKLEKEKAMQHPKNWSIQQKKFGSTYSQIAMEFAKLVSFQQDLKFL